ncbi:MAG: hypothetical protein HYV07_28325 [Deltaproteobacteria bacterium]|nr:hypothetical protein [Deltaproteobacteria bacterium]
MRRILPAIRRTPRGQILVGDEPMVFHCNHYNHWLQRIVTLSPDPAIEGSISDAAEACAYAMVTAAASELRFTRSDEKLALASSLFAELGFGTMDFASVGPNGGVVRTPTSHYGQLLLGPAGVDRFHRPTAHLDRGFAAGAAAAAFDLELGALSSTTEACHSVGAPMGLIRLGRAEPIRKLSPSPGNGTPVTVEPPPPNALTNVDEPEILRALSSLELSGNEEGFILRFGVSLTLNFASFYNRMTFEFLRRKSAGEERLAAELFVDAGHRCAFNTFGGIMTSPEWDAIVRPMCKTREDWVHGMVAVTNALGWGTWRVHELEPDRAVFRIYDDYESRGYLSHYGASLRPVSFLAEGGCAGLMNLVFAGAIETRPTLDSKYYARVFESDESFRTTQSKSLAAGDPYTEVLVERGSAS